MIQQTTDYNKFHYLPFNRPILKNFVANLADSIQQNNMLEQFPILVDKDFNVYDGQHRLEAAKQLNLPIFYTVQKNLKPSDIILVNNHHKWLNIDYFNFYIKNHFPEYLKLEKFQKDNNLSFSQVMSLFLYKKKLDEGKQFRDGRFVFNEELAEDFLVTVDLAHEINDYICMKVPEFRKYINKQNYTAALFQFLRNPLVDVEHFKKNLRICVDFFHPCRTKRDYFTIFLKVYNHRMRQRLEIGDIEVWTIGGEDV